MHSKNLTQLKDEEGFIDVTNLLEEKSKNGEHLGSWVTRPFLTEDGMNIYWKPKISKSATHFAEAVSARVARQMGLRSTKYFLAKYNQTKGIITKDFKEQDETILMGKDFLINYYKATRSDLKYITDSETFNNITFIHEALAYYVKRHTEKTDPNEFSISKNDAKKILETLLKQVMFDVAILNSDRHDKNWGLLVSKNRVRPIPVFDNDRAFLLFNAQITLYNWFNDYLKNPNKSNASVLESNFKRGSSNITPGMSILPETAAEVTKGRPYLTILKEFKSQYPAMFNECLKLFYKLDINKAISQTEEETGVVIPTLVKLTIEHSYQTRYLEVRKEFKEVEENLNKNDELLF